MSTQIAKIQIPLNKELRTLAEEKALAYGFSSVQEVVRVFLTSFVNNELKYTFTETPAEYLTSKQAIAIENKVREALSEELYTLKDGESIFDAINNAKKRNKTIKKIR